MDHRARIPLASCTMSCKKSQTQSRSLEFYDKNNSQSEDPDDKNDEEDDGDEFKLRRRHSPAKATTFTPSTPPTVAALPPPIITDEIREQLGLAKPITALEYDRLLLSLQSPLPNEQDMAISVCTLLSNDTRHALKFKKCPAVMEILLAHAGIFNHCNTRILMEETYEKARGFNFQDFWKVTVSNSDVRELLCECSLERYQNGVGIVPPGQEEEVSYVDLQDLSDIITEKPEPVTEDLEDVKSELVQSDSLPELSLVSVPTSSLSEVDSGESKSQSAPDSVPLDVVDGERVIPAQQEASTGADETGQTDRNGQTCPKKLVLDPEVNQDQESRQMEVFKLQNDPCGLILDDENDSDDGFLEEIKPPGAEREVLWDLLDKDVTASNVDCEPCCPRCPCQRQLTIFDTPVKEDDMDVLAVEKNAKVTEQIGQRIHQVASIIRNLSFDKENAEVMGRNSSILRFILVTANCSYGALTQMSFDTLGNIARFMNLEDPLENPYFGMILSLVIDGIFSIDRFRCLRSLETVREWCREESNEGIISPVMDSKFFGRLCQLLTLSDIMMIVYTLECLLSITNMGLEDVCNEVARVNGSVDTLVSLVTVEAQSYGPRGCIQMRVVETLVGQTAMMHLLRTNNPNMMGPAPDSQSVPVVSHSHSVTPTPIVQSQTFPIAIEAQNKALLLPPALIATVSPPTVNMTIDRQSPLSFQSIQPSPSPVVSPSTIYVKPMLSQPVQNTPIPPTTSTTTTTTDGRTPLLRPPVAVTVSANTTALSKPSATAPISKTAATTALLNGGYSVKSNKSLGDNTNTMTTNKVVPVGDDRPLLSFSLELKVPPSLDAAVSETAWALMWIKAAFEQISGCSIEQGKMYRMYCGARKEAQTVLSMEEFITCAKEVYGAGIGPVIKNFGGNQLSFLEGLRPTMTVTSVGNGISGTANIVKFSNSELPPNNNRLEASTEQSPPTNEQYIPPRELKTTSPILKATLSRPPKTPKNTTSKKAKVTKGKKSRSGKDESRSSTIPNPTSSVIRSLLASKVTQRQQKKQLFESKQKTSLNKSGKDRKRLMGGKCRKVNGVELIFKTEPEISSASSSLHSSGSVDSGKANPPLSFQGILQNGLSAEPALPIIDENGKDDSKGKGMLVDLLERKVVPRDNVNGLVNSREIRISDRGLELVDQDGMPWKGTVSTSNHITTESNTVNLTNSHEMTFYSAPEGEKTLKREDDQTEQFESSEEEPVVLMSGGGKNSENTTGTEEENKETVDINIDDADLLEKFNEISDLIVVPPEQLGLKRPRTSDEKCVTEEPPVKKKMVDPTSTSTPTQYTFTRPLLFSTGQQILLQTSNNSSLHGAKVIISRPTNSSGDQRQQAYFILQPQSQPPSSQASNSTQHTPTALKISALGLPRIPLQTTSVPVYSTNSHSGNHNSPKITMSTATGTEIPMPGLTSSSGLQTPTKPTLLSTVIPLTTNSHVTQATRKTSEQLDIEIPYLCEWLGCGQRFLKHEQILMHALQIHAPISLTEAIRCDWHTGGCDGLYRKRFSLMTHLQDRHCSKAALEISLYRRKNKIEPPPPPQTPVNHLGYAPNAAFHAIRRQALQFTNPKELTDDIEGPVTKSIRLTSALILKNLCNYSQIGRRSLRRHESHLASVAMSNVESARTISQLLYDMNEMGS